MDHSKMPLMLFNDPLRMKHKQVFFELKVSLINYTHHYMRIHTQTWLNYQVDP
jgi:hypothetical protein